MGEDFIFGEINFSDKIVKRRQAELSTVWHADRIEPRDPRPGQPVKIIVDIGPEIRADEVYCYWSTGQESPCGHGGRAKHGNVVRLEKVATVWEELIWGYVERWQGTIPAQKEGTLVKYTVEAWDSLKQVSAFADHGTPRPEEGTLYGYSVDAWKPPDWIHDASIYQIFVDRFSPGGNRQWNQTSDMCDTYGGTLRGIIEKLPYISNLGFNTLWLSPVSESPSAHHYDIMDHRSVAAGFGTIEDFRELVKKAHDLGMRVLLDFVTHSTSDQHPFFKAAQADQNSPYYRWYTFTHWPDEYECFYEVKSLPYLNLDYAPARKYIIDSALFWLEQGIDGFRLDYAIKPSLEFWADFQSAVRKANPDCCLIGEATASPERLRAFAGKLDGCLDFNLVNAIRSSLVHGKGDLIYFGNFLDRHEQYQDADFILPSFIDSHDMNRILFAAEGDVQKVMLAAVCQFTLSQPPIVFYGTEVGLSQPVDSWAELSVVRAPMPWADSQEHTLYKFYRILCDTRRNFASLRRGTRKILLADEKCLVYSKTLSSETCLVVLNAGDARQVSIEAGNLTGQLWDVFTSERIIAIEGKIKLELKPMQAAIFAPGIPHQKFPGKQGKQEKEC